IHDPGLESGAMIDPSDERSWTVDFGRFQAGVYGGPGLPPASVGIAVGGGSFLLAGFNPSGVSGQSQARQVIDVTGHATAIDAGGLMLRLAGSFGQSSSGAVTSRIGAVFLSQNGGQLGTMSIGQISLTQLNSEVSLIRRSDYRPIPVNTRQIRLEFYCGADPVQGLSYADDLSAMLVAAGRPPLAIDTELLANPDFEAGVLSPASEDGWGLDYGIAEAVPYGLTETPPIAVANAIAGGSQLLRISSTSPTSQIQLFKIFDLSGHQHEIDHGGLGVHASVWLGGFGNSFDFARMRVHFTNPNGSSLGSHDLGPVTALDRGNVTTLLQRTGDFVAPAGARRLRIELYLQGSGPNFHAFVDNASIVLDNESFRGTDEDLELLSGINGAPTNGPFDDLKTAVPGDILALSIRSPLGTLDFKPLILLTQIYASGSPPGSPPGFPTIHVNPAQPNIFILLDGVTSQGGIFGPPIVIPGGTIQQLLVPTGLTGMDAIFQALVLEQNAANHIFVSSNAHVISGS
ncbi:MAG: hypothetical protein KDB53_08630, partial [Planctomycetes bacterium]|nr:hypothetical protein [Planctomycetota bacterium]